MKKVHGISFSLSSLEKGLWFDHDKREYQPEGWGIRVHVVAGRMIRPVPRFWKSYSQWNTWHDPWFVIRIPFLVMPFLSVALGSLGFYIGFKTFVCTSKSSSESIYGKWLRVEEQGTDEDPAEYITLSATARRTRW
jgi:hypothetical protein